MKVKFSVLSLTVLLFPSHSWAQNTAGATQSFSSNAQWFGVEDKFRYYVSETYLNPSALTAPAFRAGIRMANPPGKGAAQYPPEWRQGAEAFGRNYGDAFAQRVTFQTARLCNCSHYSRRSSLFPIHQPQRTCEKSSRADFHRRWSI